MSNLNKDILLYISDEFQNDCETLFSCLLVNKFWFETFFPILWKDPWKFLDETWGRVLRLFNVIVLHLPDDSKELLISQDILQHLPSLRIKPSINYIGYLNQLNLKFVYEYIS